MTDPIKIFRAKKPWLSVWQLVARFSLDFARITAAIAADRDEFPSGSADCGYDCEPESELRRVNAGDAPVSCCDDVASSLPTR